MLGGSVWIALIRFGISLAGTILLFSLMSRPRFGKKKMITGYLCFCTVSLLAACIWYVVDWESCAKMVAFVLFICLAVYAVWTYRTACLHDAGFRSFLTGHP